MMDETVKIILIIMWPDLRKATFHMYTHNIKIHFHHQTIAVHVNWQFSQVLMVKVVQAAFAVACFWGFSDTHECSGHLQIPPYPLDKQTASCISPHDWLMSLAMDLAVLCHPPAPCIYDTICGKYSAWEDWQIWQKRMPFANVFPIPFTINFSYTCSSFANIFTLQLAHLPIFNFVKNFPRTVLPCKPG